MEDPIKSMEPSGSLALIDTNTMLAQVAAKDERKLVGDFAAFLAIWKGFVGGGPLYLANAWLKGGYVFSTLFLPVMMIVNGACAICLMQCYQHLSTSESPLTYEGIVLTAGGKKAGIWFKFSLILYQLGLCVSYSIFIAHLLKSSLLPDWSSIELMVLPLPIVLPLVAVRQIKRYTLTNLIANALIFTGLCITLVLVYSQLVHNGVQSYAAFNPREFAVFIGTATFSIEGNAVVMPVYAVMRNKSHFVRVVLLSYTGLTAMFLICGISGSFAYGSSTDSIEIVNLPTGLARSLVYGLFIVAILLTYPYQFLIGTRVLESFTFEPVENPSCARKAEKTLFRWFVVGIITFVAVVGDKSFDHFLSLIGSLCGIPISFIFPAFSHFKLVATKPQKIFDILICIFGLILLIMCTCTTIQTW